MDPWKESINIKLVKLKMDKKHILEMANRLYDEGLLHSGEKKLLEETAVHVERQIQELEFMLVVEEVLTSDSTLQELIESLKPLEDPESDEE